MSAKLRCGSPEEQRCAGILLPLITHRPSHQLLVTLLVLNSERRKEEKLNELMAKMDADDDA